MARYPTVSGAQTAQVIGGLNDRALRAKEERNRKREAMHRLIMDSLGTGLQAVGVGGQIYGTVSARDQAELDRTSREGIAGQEQAIKREDIAAGVTEAEKERRWKEEKQFPHERKQAEIMHQERLPRMPETIVEQRFAPIARERESGSISAEEEARELEAARSGQITPMQIAMMRLQRKDFPGNNDFRPEVLGAMKRDDLAQAFASVLSRVPIQDQDEVVMELARRVALGGKGREFPTPEDLSGIEGEIGAIKPPEQLSPEIFQAMGPSFGANPFLQSSKVEAEKQRKEALREIMMRILELKKDEGLGPLGRPPNSMGEINPETLRRLGISQAP